ncbi:sn-glycerol-3-phosphate ABC transporter ATP-binding protein UgpC [Ruegeria sp.]|uniref:ABC transporter ATP-binding protein n=1 Tax=Ruegeria sp. TaxID=1879320 RepID=UPI0023251812|nr:sn-glycerol-3-phosphate ABC transporter ATP-binding protein UgpC [Ruegeria sp.]MDA7963642.1 sn-glycerol-3-phosphate ABC transporter ATP-binding protein UgpC [Ruegeria sp.]
MARIELDGICKSYGAFQVLNDLSLDIEEGEFVVIVGPSGCGKSTLLRMVAGLEDITSGELRIGGKRANELPAQKRNIALVFQSYALFPHLNVADNIRFGPQVRGEDRALSEEKVHRAADILNLTPYLDRMPSELSGGQRQRVAMGRAIVRDPNMFLFDEPLSNLDAHLRVEMRTEIKALQRQLKTTTLYVTHDQIEAMTMSDRIVIMNHGKIEQVGAPLDLYDRPANKFVAGFLGSPSMNFMEARYEPDADTANAVLSDGQKITVPHADLHSGEKIIVGIRPDAWLLQDAPTKLTLRVDQFEPTGSETLIYGSLAEADVKCAFRERIDIGSGQPLEVGVDPGKVHIFRRDSGLRV